MVDRPPEGRRANPACLQLGGVPGAQLQRTSLRPGKERLQQLLGLGKPEHHGGIHEENPLQLKVSATSSVFFSNKLI